MRAIDKTLEDLFRDGKQYLFPGNPLEHLEAYQQFTEWSLLVDVARWPQSDDPAQRALGERWQRLLRRRSTGTWPTSALGSDPDRDRRCFAKDAKPGRAGDSRGVAGRAPRDPDEDRPAQLHRPPRPEDRRRGPKFSLPLRTKQIRPLTDDELYKHLPMSQLVCRVYLPKDAPPDHNLAVSAALDALLGSVGEDDLTNM